MLAPLFPRDHKILRALEAHLPPTSSPLHSALHFLEELLSALREQCAPIRDQAIDSLYARLDAWRDPIPNANAETSADASSLAVLIVNTIRETVALADQMKSDLNTAVIGTIDEQEVEGFVLQEAKTKERDLVLKLWDTDQPLSVQLLREKWRSWVRSLPLSAQGKFGDVPAEKKWVIRLMEQLATNQAVICSLPSSLTQEEAPVPESQVEHPPNGLPPHFLFVVPKLVYVQNYLQALTIAASLRSLTRLPIANGVGHDFMTRVWTLLKGEIDEDAPGRTNDPGSIKLINLSDEVVRARRSLSLAEDLDPEEEFRLRAAVERTLKPDDPVFVLLHHRLTDALTKGLLEPLSGDNVRNPGGNIPQIMRTGRALGDSRPGKRPRINFSDHGTANPATANPIRSEGATAPVTIKGFEDPTLANAFGGVYAQIVGCITWIEAVWGDMVW